MNTKLILGALVMIILAGGIFFYSQSKSKIGESGDAGQSSTAYPSMESRVRFIKDNPQVTDPHNGVIGIGTDIEGTDITGWTIRSTSSGKSFVVGEVNLGDRKYNVVLSAGGGAIIHAGGEHFEDSSAEGEYHLWAPDTWNIDHDTIQLLDKEGRLVDTLTY